MIDESKTVALRVHKCAPITTKKAGSFEPATANETVLDQSPGPGGFVPVLDGGGVPPGVWLPGVEPGAFGFGVGLVFGDVGVVFGVGQGFAFGVPFGLVVLELLPFVLPTQGLAAFGDVEFGDVGLGFVSFGLVGFGTVVFGVVPGVFWFCGVCVCGYWVCGVCPVGGFTLPVGG